MGADAARKRKRAALREGADAAQPPAKVRVLEEDFISLDGPQDNAAHASKSAKSGNEKQETSENTPTRVQKTLKPATSPDPERADTDTLSTSKPSKRRNKEKKKPKPSPDEAVDGAKPDPSTTSKSKGRRFIAFVGNLPYTATTPAISSHFSSLHPTSIRHSTDKATGRSNGYAFLEFPTYDKLLTCLTKYHHSVFAPPGGISDANRDPGDERQKKAGRKINVELTAGGGGKKSSVRKGKLEKKNESLELQRERRRKKEAEAAEGEKKKVKNSPSTGANAEAKAEVKAVKEPKKQLEKEEGISRDAIHPSRLRFVK